MATSNKPIGGTPAGPTRQHYRLATGENVLEGQASEVKNSGKKSGGLSTMKSSKSKSK
jgi:hypothetical protein